MERICPAILYAAVETPFGLSALLKADTDRLPVDGSELLEPGTERPAAIETATDFGRVTISSLLERQDRPTQPARAA